MTDRDSDMVLVPRELLQRAHGYIEQHMTSRGEDWYGTLRALREAIAAAPSATAPTDEALREIVARIFDAAGFLSEAGVLRHSKDSNAAWISECLNELRTAMRRVSLSAPREGVYRAALEEIASGLSVENPYDIANRALKETKP